MDKAWHFSIWSCRYFLAVSQCAFGLICSRYPSSWHPIYQEIWACQIPPRLRHFSIFIALFAPTRPNVQKVRTPCCVDIRRAFYGRLGDIRSWTYDKCQNQILDISYTSSSTPFPKRRLSISLFGWWSDGKERREESDKSQFWNFNEKKNGHKTPKQSDSALTYTTEKQKKHSVNWWNEIVGLGGRMIERYCWRFQGWQLNEVRQSDRMQRNVAPLGTT